MKTVSHLSGLLLIFLLLSCGTNRREYRQPYADARQWEALALKKYGSGVEFVFNSTKSAVLCLKKSKSAVGDMRYQVSFLIFDLSADSAIFEDSLPDGSVEWKNDFSVQVTTVPGIVTSDEKPGGSRSGYIFDLRVRKTRSLDATDVQEIPQGIIR